MSDARGRSVLVTGGAGFIGSHVADAYLAAGYSVSIIDDLSRGRTANVPKGVRLIKADIRSPEAHELLASGEFAILNHHAAQIDVRSSVEDPAEDTSANVLGFLNLLDGARLGRVRRIVFASSGGAIYADGVSLPIAEHGVKLPLSPYGVSKLSAEYHLAAFARLYAIDTVALRYSNVYGPRQDAAGEAGVVAIFMRRALAGEPLVVYGDGDQTRDLVYVGDVAAANVMATECPLPPLSDVDARAYNIATGVETTVNQLADLVSEIVGRVTDRQYAAERAGEVRRNALANGKAVNQLSWSARTPLRDGLQQTLLTFSSTSLS